MSINTAYQLLAESYSAWKEDKVERLGAALAYYSVFSLAPLVVIAIGMAGLVFGEQAARGGIVQEIESTVGRPVALAVQEIVKNTSQDGQCWYMTVIGLIILLFGASGVFVQLQDAMNTIWKVTPKPGQGIWSLVKERFLSFTIVLGTGFLLLVSLIVSAALAALAKYVNSPAMPGTILIWQIVNAAVSLASITLLFALIFKLLPDVKIAWQDIWIGGAVTALLFSLGKYLLALYLGQTSPASAFGAAGSLVVVLVWVYYSSQILLFGAEFTRIYALHFRSSTVPTHYAAYGSPQRPGLPGKMVPG